VRLHRISRRHRTASFKSFRSRHSAPAVPCASLVVQCITIYTIHWLPMTAFHCKLWTSWSCTSTLHMLLHTCSCHMPGAQATLCLSSILLFQANRQKWSGLVRYCRQQPGVDQQLERTGEPAGRSSMSNCTRYTTGCVCQ
jgi:hypothetical protein